MGLERSPRERAGLCDPQLNHARSSVAVHYTLDSYGNVLDGDTSLVRYIYTGQEFDPRRAIIITMSATTTPPPAASRAKIDGLSGDMSNLYRYVGNAATMFVDPSGLGPWGAAIGEGIGAGGGFVIGIVGGLVTALPRPRQQHQLPCPLKRLGEPSLVADWEQCGEIG